MSTINEAISLVRSGLFDPKEQCPTLDQIFTQLMFEFQAFMNELDSTNQPWTYATKQISLSPGQTDYAVTGEIGKVLFAYAEDARGTLGPVGLEIADLAEVSSDFYPFNPLDYGVWRDFNELWSAPRPAQIALFRQNGTLYFRLAPFFSNVSTVTLVHSTGSWTEDLDLEDTAVLKAHHMLPITRAMQNLLPGSEWWDDDARNENRKNWLEKRLDQQEKRYDRNFLYAKREMGVSGVVMRDPVGGPY